VFCEAGFFFTKVAQTGKSKTTILFLTVRFQSKEEEENNEIVLLYRFIVISPLAPWM
jgi:hypothetical protein